MAEHNTDLKGGLRCSPLDLVIFLAILSLIISLTLPAVAHVRESARKASCADHLRQLGVALHAYHDSFELFPAASYWDGTDLDLPNLLSHQDPTRVEVTGRNWVQDLLPFMGEEELHSQFDQSVAVVARSNRTARTTEFPRMHCPSDTYNTQDNHYILDLPDGTEAEFARGNYAINGGSEYVPVEFGTLANPGPTDNRYIYNEDTRQFQWWGNGLAGINKCFSVDDVVNGQSTFVALEEVRAGIDPIDPRGVWALGQIGGSITWGHGVVGDDGGPNYQEKDSGPDDILGAPALYEKLGSDFIEAERMGACSYCNENAQATSRSQHDSGVNVLMLDGAVRFVSDNIENTLWHVIHSRETPNDVFNESSFREELSGTYISEEAAHPVSTSIESELASFENSVGMTFVPIPAGRFVMGLPNKDNDLPFPDDAIPHEVTISKAFLLGQHEVTQRQYEDIMGVNPSWHTRTGKYASRVVLSDTSDCPVENVSWNDAKTFCERLSALRAERAHGRRYRLPTEAEWEYACRGGQTTSFQQSADSGELEEGILASTANGPANSIATTKTGSFPANPFGLHDMCGNVYEWTADFRRRGYYAKSPEIDPQGPRTGYLHVVRGWYWVATGPHCKVYVAQDPWQGNPFIGFRVVCEIIHDRE